MTNNEEYLTLDDLSAKFGVSYTTLRTRMKEGVITPEKRTKDGYQFPKSEIDKLKKEDLVRRFKIQKGHRNRMEEPTDKELELLEKYILEGNRGKISGKMEISRQRLAQRIKSIAYRLVYFNTVDNGKLCLTS